LSSDFVAALKAEWFERFDQILDDRKTIPSSNMKCIEMCQARCCPRAGMRTLPEREIASPIVVLLPFEMEYLIEKTGVSVELFRRWPLPLTPDVTIEIGMLDLGKPCPFLQDNLLCSIHDHNPLDCRTFPLLPVLNPHDHLEWQLGQNCPSLAFLNPGFVDAVKEVWQDLLPHLPRAWWDIYAFADHWTGWPQPAESWNAS
jgi:Fe-S-cluster containining protein